ELVADRQARFPTSGEQNFTIDDPMAALKLLEAELGPEANEVSHADGLSLDFGEWRMNVRPSGTEPLVRLNIESRGDAGLVSQQLARVQARLKAL
ncbi:MAG: phosphomannomutase, partial [Rhodobacteraceae bacterium]|nr:phosphomannomutase [Paracoccaceae bacterium]